MGQLDGQVAFITGGARGMGRSHAVTLAKEGADVTLFDLCHGLETLEYQLSTPEDLAETANLVEKEGRRCIAITGDVRDLEEVKGAVERTITDLGRIDIVVANAGIGGGAAIQVANPKEWEDIVAVNLTGVFHTLHAAAPAMIKQGYGRMVAISSMMGRGVTPALGAYAASKWGVIGLVKTSAQDLARFGITVNALAPGNIDTPLVRNEMLFKKVRPDLEHPTFEDAAQFLGLLHVQPTPVLHPQSVSNALLFLVGPGAEHITGAVIDVSAGASARVTA
jgi:SDR family mycofactocin-dependent oxidoreductase